MPREIAPTRQLSIRRQRETFRVESEVADDHKGTGQRRFTLRVHGYQTERTEDGTLVSQSAEIETVTVSNDAMPAAVRDWLDKICDGADQRKSDQEKAREAAAQQDPQA